MRIGRYDLWNEYDSVAAVLGSHNRALKSAYASAQANNPIQCWEFAKDSLMEFGCNPQQATQLMSIKKDLRQLDLCRNLDPSVHVLRAYLGRCAYRNRLELRMNPVSIQAEQCIGSGIVSVGPDELELTDKLREDVARELTSAPSTLSKNPSNMVLSQGGNSRAGYESCHALLKLIMPLLSEITGYTQMHLREELANTAFVQKVVNGPEDNDIQKVLHQDTWFDAWKFWYFPHDVYEGDGSFRFATYSHGLSSARLRLMKEFATPDHKWESWRSAGHDEGSWRVSDGELLTMGEGAYDVPCSAGTLVIANVYAYHARGLANQVKERIALHGSIRMNPWT